jgi:O-antigen ligase
MTFETAQIYYKSDKIMHPHNFVLQIWMEFGFLGVSFFSAFIFFILRRIYQSQSAHRNLLFAIFCMAVTFLFVSWSMWASWLLGMIFFMTGITAKGGSEKGQAYVKAY